MIVVRALPAAMLVLAGLSKLGRRDDFARAILGYRIVGWRTARLLGSHLPRAEILVGAALAVSLLSPLTELVAAGLFTAFAAALSMNLARGRRDIDCGCFARPRAGDRGAGISWWHAVRAGALAAMAGAAALAGPARGRELLMVVGTTAALALALALVQTVRAITTGPELDGERQVTWLR